MFLYPPLRLIGVLHLYRSPLANSTKYSGKMFRTGRASKGSETWSVPSKTGRFQRAKEENIASSLHF